MDIKSRILHRHLGHNLSWLYLKYVLCTVCTVRVCAAVVVSCHDAVGYTAVAGSVGFANLYC